MRREPRRQDQPLIVAVHHDDRADHARRKPPRSRPAVLQHAGLIEVANLEGFREILPQVVRSAELQRLSVAHHGFQRIRDVGPGELLGVRLSPRDHGNRGFAHREIRVDVEHLPRLGLALFGGGVRGVALLPEKFERAQEKPRAQFPAHYAVPLIDQHGQVAIRLNPFRVCVPDDRFRGRPDHQRLFQLFAAAVRHDRELGRKARHVRLFLLDEASRDQQRKRSVHVPGGLEPLIERRRDVFPQRPAVRPHDHAAAHRRVVRELSPQDELVVPFREILRPRRQLQVRHSSPLYRIAPVGARKRFRLGDSRLQVNQHRSSESAGRTKLHDRFGAERSTILFCSVSCCAK